ncbi:hypothetical protein CINF_1088 [Candidatus Campylobacter infans]|uniref:Uncharacterized protein n=1 Tax=Candidatus Campylobacter infans TaxID=2561898 RepID=A0A7H9CI05_9BACT|nr:hypothetical protein CINF_1088 [Candidatus Campylobacter infans]
MRDKALNQKHKIINLKFQWIVYFYSLNSNFQKSFNFKISKIFFKTRAEFKLQKNKKYQIKNIKSQNIF